jgi:hypothetical protein
MKINSDERVCGLSGRIYVWIEYLLEPSQEFSELYSLIPYIENKHGEINREVIYENCRWGYRVRIIKQKVKR